MFIPTKIKRFRLFSLLILAVISILTLYWVVTSSFVLSILPEEAFPQGPRQEPFIKEVYNANKFLQQDFGQPHVIISLPPQDIPVTSPKVLKESESARDHVSNTKLLKLKLAQMEIAGRVKKASEFCKKYHLGRFQWPNGTNNLNIKEPPTPLFSYYFWNRQRNIAWCPVYKAGSTSGLHNMMILAGYSEDQLTHPPKQLSSLARDAYPSVDIGNGTLEDSLKLLESSLKLLVVRHPFERLVSAYKDKLSNSSVGHEDGTFYYYEMYGAKIVKKFRKEPLPQKEPTWEEFVTYLVSSDLLQYSDDHWLPAYYSCTPCLVPYDVIAKTETYLRDQEFIIWKMGLQDILHPQWRHPSSLSLGERNSLSSSYFSQLSKSLIKQLYLKYSLDFDLFGYEYESYLNLGHSNE